MLKRYIVTCHNEADDFALWQIQRNRLTDLEVEELLECKDCCIYDTEACRYGKYALEHDMSKQCDDFIVEHNKAYQQGYADAITEFDRICEETRSHNFGVCDADFVIDVIKAKVKEQLKEQTNE